MVNREKGVLSDMFTVRRVVSLLAVLLIACTGRSTAPDSEAADLILYNGKVVTVDSGFCIARAVAIRGDRIVAVGDDARVRALRAQRRGRSISRAYGDPGPDGRPPAQRRRWPGHRRSPGVRSIEELLAAVAARASAAQPGEILVSNSDWHEAQLKEKRLPHRRELRPRRAEQSRGAGARRARVHPEPGGARALEHLEGDALARPAARSATTPTAS